MSELRVKSNRPRYGMVFDFVLENTELSLEARAVAAWLSGRQNGFRIKVKFMREHFLGIGEKRWNGIRKELEAVGWWRSTRASTGVRGQFVWTHEFSENGCFEVESTIQPSGMDAPSRHAVSTHATRGDNHKELNQQEVNQKELNHPPVPLVARGQGQEGGPSIDELLKAAVWEVEESGRSVSTAWKQAVRKRMDGGAGREFDIDLWQRWREAEKRVAKHVATLDAVRKAPELDPEVCAKGAALLGKKRKECEPRAA